MRLARQGHRPCPTDYRTPNILLILILIFILCPKA